MKKAVCVILAVFMMSLPVLADDVIKVTVDGEELTFDQNPVIINDRTMVPMRAIFEKLGASVSWDGETKTVTAEGNGRKIVLPVGSTVAAVNGEAVFLDSPAVIIEGRTLVPVRFVSEAMGAEVTWDASARTVCIKEGNNILSAEMSAALSELDTRYDKKLFDWVINLYDPSGGFYYANSARDYDGFLPDIESTCQAWGRIIMHGGIDSMEIPEDIRQKTVDFLCARQDAEDGYFYDTQYGKNVGNSKKERNTSYASSEIKTFGGTLPYLTPVERAEANIKETADRASNIYESEESVKAWLDGLNWDGNPYSACHEISSASEMLNANGYAAMVADYLRERQNPETGLWGEGLNYTTLSAAMKASPMFKPRFNTGEFPNAGKMIKSVVEIVKTCKPDTLAMLCNPVYLLIYARDSFGANGFPQEMSSEVDKNLAEIIKSLSKQLDEFRQPDNGYGYFRSGSSPVSQGVTVSLGYPEGDVNAMALALDIRDCSWRLAAGKTPQCFREYLDEAWEKMRNAKAPSKIKLELGCDDNFTGLKLDAKPNPEKWTLNEASGSILIGEDPDRSKNRVLQINTKPGGNTEAKRICFTGTAYNVLTFECRLQLTECATYDLFYNAIGETAVSWIFTKRDKSADTITLSTRTSSQGYGDTICELSQDEWYKIRIEFEPKDAENTKVRFYIDDELKLETNKFYNGGKDGASPQKDHKSIRFTAFNAAKGTMLLDDMKVTLK